MPISCIKLFRRNSFAADENRVLSWKKENILDHLLTRMFRMEKYQFQRFHLKKKFKNCGFGVHKKRPETLFKLQKTNALIRIRCF